MMCENHTSFPGLLRQTLPGIDFTVSIFSALHFLFQLSIYRVRRVPRGDGRFCAALLPRPQRRRVRRHRRLLPESDFTSTIVYSSLSDLSRLWNGFVRFSERKTMSVTKPSRVISKLNGTLTNNKMFYILSHLYFCGQ